MGNTPATSRFHDDSDVVVTFDPRARILDVPDDGRVMEMLSCESHGAPERLGRIDRFAPEAGWRVEPGSESPSWGVRGGPARAGGVNDRTRLASRT